MFDNRLLTGGADHFFSGDLRPAVKALRAKLAGMGVLEDHLKHAVILLRCLDGVPDLAPDPLIIKVTHQVCRMWLP